MSTDSFCSWDNALKEAGWVEVTKNSEYKKNGCTVVFDTGSWMMLITEDNRRLFDVAVPAGEYWHRWTLNLIDHLFKMDDQLRAAERSQSQAIR